MRISLVVALLLVVGSVTAQQETKPFDTLEFAKKIFVYNSAKQYNDESVARMALYQLLAENPNNVALRDSLALSYFQSQQYASAALVAQEVVSAVPSDMFAVEIAAISFERLGVKNRALNFYSKLYLDDSDDLNTLYKMAFLQNDLKLFEEANNSANQLAEHKLAKEFKLVFPTDDGQGQEVTMDVAATRLKGMIAAAQGDKAKAKEHFDAALKAFPAFEVVKKQLAELAAN